MPIPPPARFEAPLTLSSALTPAACALPDMYLQGGRQ